MFERSKLYKAIIANDEAAIRALVALKGERILAQRLPGTVSRPPRSDDKYLRGVFRWPTALTLALFTADASTVDVLVELGASVAHSSGVQYPNMLFVATAAGRVDILEKWLDQYPALAQQETAFHFTLLHIACQHKRPVCTKVLLARDFLPFADRRSPSWCHPFVIARYAGDTESEKLMMDVRMSVFSRTQENIQARAPIETSKNDVPPASETITTPAPVQEGWHIIDENRVAKITNIAALGYRLTDIFNFATGEILHLSRNMETAFESRAVSSFADQAQHKILAEAAAYIKRPFDPDQWRTKHSGKIVLKK